MRLVDADALKEAMNYNGGCGICFRYVDDAPTIEAIPVEWLWKISERILSTTGQKLVDALIERWQEEQEAQD